MLRFEYYLLSIIFCFGLLAAISIFSFSSKTALAQTSIQTIEQQGIVPCGKGTSPSCKVCDIYKLAQNVTDYIIGLAFFVATAAIAIGGVMILIGAYSEERVKLGKEILTDGIVGLLIILFAWLMVDTIIKVLVTNGNFLDITRTTGSGFQISNLGPWNAIRCVEP